MDLVGSSVAGCDVRFGAHRGFRRQPTVERLWRPGRGRTGCHRRDADRGNQRWGREWVLRLGWRRRLRRSELLRLGRSVDERSWRELLDQLWVERWLEGRRHECRLWLKSAEQHFQRRPSFVQGQANSAEQLGVGRRRQFSECLRVPDRAGRNSQRPHLVRHIERRRAPANWDPRHARARGSAHAAAFPATELMPSDR